MQNLHPRKGQVISYAERPLLEKNCTTFIRFNEAISILHKIQAFNEATMDKSSSSSRPFGIRSDFKDYKNSPDSTHTIKLYRFGGIGYISPSSIERKHEWIGKHKVLESKAYGIGSGFPSQMISPPIYAEPNAVCTETYIVLGVFDTEQEAQNLASYVRTRFFRFLISLKKLTQNVIKEHYALVPLQDFSQSWSDEMLYKKYGISEEEIAYIESRIKGM